AVDRLAAFGDLAHAAAEIAVDAVHAFEHRRGLGARHAAAVEVARGHGADGVANARDRILGTVRELADLFVERGRALGQVAHLVGDDGEATAGFAGTRGLDRGIEREQVGLVGDRLDVLEQREDAVQVFGHGVDVGHGDAALAADRFECLHQLLHLLAGVEREAVHVRAAAVAVVAAVDDARGDFALLARAAVDRVEAGAELGHRLADQLAGAVDLVARTLDFGADEAAQIFQQPALVAQQRRVAGRGPGYGP